MKLVKEEVYNNIWDRIYYCVWDRGRIQNRIWHLIQYRVDNCIINRIQVSIQEMK